MNVKESLWSGFSKERLYYFNACFSENDFTEYKRAYQMLGGMWEMLEYYRAVLEDFEQNKLIKSVLIDVPLLVLGEEIGSAPNIFEAIEPLGTNVSGGLISGNGHYIPEEQPKLLAEAMIKSFSFIILHNFVNTDIGR